MWRAEFAGLRNNGYTFPNLVGRPEYGNTGFPILGAGSFLGINYSIWLWWDFALVAYIVTSRLPFGRHVYAIGGNERAAELSGVRVNRTKVIVYSISGLCAAMVGLIIASQLVAAHPASGESFELTAIAAVVLGGTSLAGGRGSIGGTIDWRFRYRRAWRRSGEDGCLIFLAASDQRCCHCFCCDY